MVDIQSATAEIRRGKKEDRKKEKKPQGKNIVSASAVQGMAIKTEMMFVKAKFGFHYASWFKAGHRQVRSWSATGFEPAPNQLRTR